MGNELAIENLVSKSIFLQRNSSCSWSCIVSNDYKSSDFYLKIYISTSLIETGSKNGEKITVRIWCGEDKYIDVWRQVNNKQERTFIQLILWYLPTAATLVLRNHLRLWHTKTHQSTERQVTFGESESPQRLSFSHQPNDWWECWVSKWMSG